MNCRCDGRPWSSTLGSLLATPGRFVISAKSELPDWSTLAGNEAEQAGDLAGHGSFGRRRGGRVGRREEQELGPAVEGLVGGHDLPLL